LIKLEKSDPNNKNPPTTTVIKSMAEYFIIRNMATLSLE